jgi:hypothetical protein
MNENDLDKLLRRAARRVRFERALQAALAVLGITLVCSAAAVLWLHWIGHENVPILPAASIPVTLALAGGLLAFLMARADLATLAARVDRAANISEHLVTWLYLREKNTNAPASKERDFKAAQRDSALKAAECIRLKKHLPVRVPAWGRAIWLAIIFLFSAILMPASTPIAASRMDRNSPGGIDAGGENASSRASAQQREAPKIEVLSPAELRKLQLIATDPDLLAAAKSEALKELLNSMGGIPESELTPEVRQLLDILRKETASKSVANPEAAGSIASATQNQSEAQRFAAEAKAAGYRPFENPDKGWAAAEANFPDVAERLKAYYERNK